MLPGHLKGCSPRIKGDDLSKLAAKEYLGKAGAFTRPTPRTRR